MTSYVAMERSKLSVDIKTQLIVCLAEEWHWIFEGEDCFWDTIERNNNPISFVALEDGALVSHAEVTRRNLEYVDRSYNVYGLGAVFTQREYRNLGYGSQVVKAATNYILKSDADLGMLFCDESLKGFYEKAGWNPASSLQVLCGPPENPWRNEGEAIMCVFPSKSSQDMQAQFVLHPLYVGVQHW